jgi:hypothetical protein
LISGCAQVEISNKVKDILWSLCIYNWQREPHQQHQNPCEPRYQNLKMMTNTVLDRTGSPAYLWLLCLQYVAFILNNSVSDALNGATPLQLLTGSTNDISPLLFFKCMTQSIIKLMILTFLLNLEKNVDAGLVLQNMLATSANC